jgi:hypothetical protein
MGPSSDAGPTSESSTCRADGGAATHPHANERQPTSRLAAEPLLNTIDSSIEFTLGLLIFVLENNSGVYNRFWNRRLFIPESITDPN